jgi:ATP-dependent DNA helicase RecG
MPSFKIANPVLDQDILQLARADAFKLIKQDPHLRNSENYPLKTYFVANYGEKIKYIKIS